MYYVQLRFDQISSPHYIPPVHKIREGSGWESDYIVPVCLTPPHTIHPPHQISEILEESEIVFQKHLTH